MKDDPLAGKKYFLFPWDITKINFLPIKTLDKIKQQTEPEPPEILICSPEEAWLLCREVGAVATQTRRILISWFPCKGKIYCSLPEVEALQKRGHN